MCGLSYLVIKNWQLNIQIGILYKMEDKTRRAFLRHFLGGLAGLVLSGPLVADCSISKNVNPTRTDSVKEFAKNLKIFQVYDAGEYEVRVGESYEDRIPNYQASKPRLDRLRQLGEKELSDKLLDSVGRAYAREYASASTPATLASWGNERRDYLLQFRTLNRLEEDKGDSGLVVVRLDKPKKTGEEKDEVGQNANKIPLHVYTLRPVLRYRGQTVLDAVADENGNILVAEIGGPEDVLENIAFYQPGKDGSYSELPDGYISLNKLYEPCESGAVRVYGADGSYKDGILLRYRLGGEEGHVLLGTKTCCGKFPLYRLKESSSKAQTKDARGGENGL
jgi:hypothetical protein